MSEEIERIAKLEEKVKHHDRKLEAQDEKNESLTRLVTLFETQEKNNQEREKRQEERDRKQQEQMDKFGTAMEEVVVSLANINQNQQQLGERVTDIESTLQEGKIDVFKLFKSILSYIATGLGSIAIAYLIWIVTK